MNLLVVCERSGAMPTFVVASFKRRESPVEKKVRAFFSPCMFFFFPAPRTRFFFKPAVQVCSLLSRFFSCRSCFSRGYAAVYADSNLLTDNCGHRDALAHCNPIIFLSDPRTTTIVLALETARQMSTFGLYVKNTQRYIVPSPDSVQPSLRCRSSVCWHAHHRYT